MNLFRVLISILALALAGAAFAQSGERGSIAPGESKDGAAPSDGAIQGGTILPGETGGLPEGRAAPGERASRCNQLTGTLREDCLRQERNAGVGGSKAPSSEVPPSPPLTPPPQNPR